MLIRERYPPTFGSSGTDGCMEEEASFFSDALLKMTYSNSDAHLFSSSNM